MTHGGDSPSERVWLLMPAGAEYILSWLNEHGTGFSLDFMVGHPEYDRRLLTNHSNQLNKMGLIMSDLVVDPVSGRKILQLSITDSGREVYARWMGYKDALGRALENAGIRGGLPSRRRHSVRFKTAKGNRG